MKRAREKLDEYVTLRGVIAHRGSSGAACKKKHVEEYFGLVRKLASKTGGQISKFVRQITGKRLW